MDTFRGMYLGCDPAIGSFGWVKRNGSVDWESCRDYFLQRSGGGTRKFAFLCGHHGDPLSRNKGNAVRDFMREFELRANIKRNKIKISNFRPNAVLVTFSSFWRQRMNRSLLSALLRAGLNYNDFFEKALYQQIYLAQTRYAVERFMSGYRKFRGKRFDGWAAAFRGIHKHQIDELLGR